MPTVVRSTWDYPQRAEAFLAWVERAGRAAPFWNPPAVVRTNVHKEYLLALAQRGVPIVPTVLLARGARTRLADVLRAQDWDDVVVKPAVSAASFGTMRVRAQRADERAAGEMHLARLLRERDVLVQVYAPAVATSGERALVWIDGALTHAVRKSPRFAGESETVSGSVAIAPDEHALALAALAPLAAGLLYARVDIVRDDAGRPCVMELELVEPSLFLVQHPPALARFADALRARLR